MPSSLEYKKKRRPCPRVHELDERKRNYTYCGNFWHKDTSDRVCNPESEKDI